MSTPSATSTPARPPNRTTPKPLSRSPSLCSRLQECLTSPGTEDKGKKGVRSDLDNKVGHRF